MTPATLERLERARQAGRAHAMRHPKKAAAMLVRIRQRDIPAAHGRGHDDEVQRLEHIARGIADELSLDGTYKLCRRCGETLKDPSQPGWELDLGPICVKKETTDG